MSTFLFVFVGGGLGSVARFSVSRMITSNFQSINPVATLVSNVFSTLILGIVLYLAGNKAGLSPTVKTLLVVGFCGGYSTFSTFSYETFELLRNGNLTFAITNITLSLLLSVGVLYFLAKII